MRKKTGITFHTAIDSRKKIEVGELYACKEDIHIQLRVKTKDVGEWKLEQIFLPIKKWVQLKIKAITNSVPRAVVFDTPVQEGDMIPQEVSYPLWLFQHYFTRILQSDIPPLLWYTKK